MKKQRQEKLLDLISRYEIDTQDELIERLRESGYDATQATISRDIRELKIAKITTGRGTYRYVLPKQMETGSGMKFNTALIDSITAVDYVFNQVVLRTFPGLANAVAVAIDGMEMEQILGCVAGDDTILVICRSEESAVTICSRVKELLRPE